ncbi:histidine kinase [Cytophagaceae bacterium DM2B3-1]|uniref:Histidine kinase n=1 Tax=Xanthocytophaga flava TaxID=3048013 RepID=A0ABT7CHM3_9BACT|nr:histidine kinase [Xanthocytophaga flavus]MDJ1493232.1 histidine kinase [Xanthocytophaga flavus]
MYIFNYDFVFSNQWRYRLARHILFWIAFILFCTVIYSYRPVIPEGVSYWKIVLMAFTNAIIFTFNHIALSYSIIYWLIPSYLLKGKYIHLAIGLCLCILGSGFFSFFLSSYIVNGYLAILGWPIHRFPLSIGLMAGLRGGITIAGFAAAIKLSKYWYLKQSAFQQVEKEKLTAELQLLKAQLHPHFLFNTLNNLYALTLTKSDYAPEVVVKLSGLLRYMLYDCNVAEVSLEKEIQIIQNYVELEQMRYGEHVDVSLNFTGDITGKMIAPLLLMPFLENAFKHGVSEQIDQAWISLDLSVDKNRMRLKLINSKSEENQVSSYTGGIGLQNVKKRMELIYPKQYDLKIVEQDEIFVVILNLELQNDITKQTENSQQYKTIQTQWA